MEKTLFLPIKKWDARPYVRADWRKISEWRNVAESYSTLVSIYAKIWQILVLEGTNPPVLVDAQSYFRHQKNGFDKWLGDVAYLESTSPIAWLPLRAGVIRRKTKVAKLLKQFNTHT